VAATLAAAISEVIAIGELELWVRGALGELRAAVTAQDILQAGLAAGIYDDRSLRERARPVYRVHSVPRRI
jgi:hypothetical protein